MKSIACRVGQHCVVGWYRVGLGFVRYPDISVGILIGPENVGRYFEKACRYFDRA